MATLAIETDKKEYEVGETVTGRVLMHVAAKIKGPQGVSLKFTGYECVKWLEHIEIPTPSSPSPGKPAVSGNKTIPLEQIYRTDKFSISQCHSEEASNSELRPQYIRTASNRYYEIKYHDNRSELVKSKAWLLQCSELAAGQYAFPFSLKTHEGWPGSFSNDIHERKASMVYHLRAAVEPVTPHFQFEAEREIILHEKRPSKMVERQSTGTVTSFCCIGKGSTFGSVSQTDAVVHAGSSASIEVEIDNSQCSADVNSIQLSVVNVYTLKAGALNFRQEKVMHTQTLSGVAAGQSLLGEKAIRERITLPQDLKATCSGKLVSSQTQLKLAVKHSTAFGCLSTINEICSPLIVGSPVEGNSLSTIFTSKWSPKLMPPTLLVTPPAAVNLNETAMGSAEKFPAI